MRGRQGIKQRQRSALELLQAQLKRGTKPEKVDGHTTNKQIELTDGDKTRIKSQIEGLEKSLVS